MAKTILAFSKKSKTNAAYGKMPNRSWNHRYKKGGVVG